MRFDPTTAVAEAAEPPHRRSNSDLASAVAIYWGIGGVLLTLVWAVVRLGPRFLDALAYEPRPRLFWPAVLASLVFFVYTEAYRGFHLRFSPRVVARALALARRSTPLLLLLAPAYCMGLVHATRIRLIASWILVLGIVLLVLLVRQLSHPWRGIIDLGVAIALFLGSCSILWFWWRARSGSPPSIDPDLPPDRSR